MIVSASVVVTDIEGTTTPIAFVHDVLFPYARRALPAYVAAHPDDPDVQEAQHLAPDGDALAALLGWMDADAKIAPLKSLQGRLWREGYLAGEIKGVLYPDVIPALRRWHEAGVRLCVYSSGSVEAQRLLFGHTEDGDTCALFSGFFDTRTGAKRDAASYASIAGELREAAGRCLFLSDVEAELDAARAAGMQTCQLIRAEDGTAGSSRHPGVADFAALTLAP